MRSTMLVVAVGALAACYSPSYVDCMITCASSGTCPSGYACEQGVCRAPGAMQPCGALPNDSRVTDGLDGPPDDVDADGVKNVDDNCPNHTNTDQANEDRDAFGDVCDPCPPFAGDADNADDDMDGVGNSCDPSPGASGNSIVVFAGFADAMKPAGSNAVGNWAFNIGSATITNLTQQPAYLHWPQLPSNGETVVTRFTVIDIASSPNAIGTVINLDPTMNRAIICWLLKPDAAQPGVLSLFALNQTGAPVTAPDDLVPGRTYQIDMSRRSFAYSCTEPSATNGVNAQQSYSSPTPATGVVAQSVVARFDWILIVSGT